MIGDLMAAWAGNPLACVMFVMSMVSILCGPAILKRLRGNEEAERDRLLEESLRELDVEFPAALALPSTPATIETHTRPRHVGTGCYAVVAADLVAPAPTKRIEEMTREEFLRASDEGRLRPAGQPPLRQPPPLPSPAPSQIQTSHPRPKPSWRDCLSQKLLVAVQKPERLAMGCGHALPADRDGAYCRRRECPFGVHDCSPAQALIRLWDGRVLDAGDYKDWCDGRVESETLKDHDTAGSWVPRVQPQECVFPRPARTILGLPPSDTALNDWVEK